MYKYSISMYDWEKPLNVVMKKVYIYDSLHSNVDDICTATALVDLCRDRDNHRYDVFTHSDIIDIIQMLCTCQFVFYTFTLLFSHLYYLVMYKLL